MVISRTQRIGICVLTNPYSPITPTTAITTMERQRNQQTTRPTPARTFLWLPLFPEYVARSTRIWRSYGSRRERGGGGKGIAGQEGRPWIRPSRFATATTMTPKSNLKHLAIHFERRLDALLRHKDDIGVASLALLTRIAGDVGNLGRATTRRTGRH